MARSHVQYLGLSIEFMSQSMSESRQAREERLRLAYAAYVAQCKRDAIEAIDWQNWAYNQKVKEREST